MTDDLKPEDYTSPPDPLPTNQEQGQDEFVEAENPLPLTPSSLRKEGEYSELVGDAPEPVAVYEVVEEDGYRPAVLETFVNQDGEFVLEEQPTAVSVEPEAATYDKPSEPIWVRLRRGLFGGKYGIDDPDFTGRLRSLNNAIESAPRAPVNYVIRGELYLSAGLYDLARDDFRQGYALASAEYDNREWGILAQTLGDRALAGLGKAEKKLQTTSGS